MSGRDVFETWAATAVRIGELVALADDGTAMVIALAAPLAVRPARSVVDLGAEHIGQAVVLAFEGGDPARPIVLGVLRGGEQRPQALEVESDGERMVVSARRELVLRCGKASITLTRAGKVVIDGTQVLSRATGANRVKGGSVQLN